MYKQIKNLIIDLGGNHEDNASFWYTSRSDKNVSISE